jgi:sulfatase maturation enzyme AslB (radical SAM superfamily)
MKENSLTHKMERKAAQIIIDNFIKSYKKDNEKALLSLVDYAEKFYGDSYPKETYDSFRTKLKNPEYKWRKFLDKLVAETDPHVLETVLLNLVYESFFRGTKTIRANREKYNCNIPWLILFDPTSACNMHCTGCWSGTYGHKHNLTYEDMDKIVTEGKELGPHLYMMTGGEPLVRKADILKLAEKHNDCIFSIYSNSTLIDEEF